LVLSLRKDNSKAEIVTNVERSDELGSEGRIVLIKLRIVGLHSNIDVIVEVTQALTTHQGVAIVTTYTEIWHIHTGQAGS